MRARRWLPVVVVVLVVLLGAFGWRARSRGRASAASAAARDSAPGARAVPVTVATVRARDVALTLEGLGNVGAFYTVTVRSQVEGRIDKVLFTEGQTVKKGDPLVQIDARPFAIQVHVAQAALARDQALLANAQINLTRYTTLQSGGVGSEQQVADQRAEVAKDQAIVAGDRASLETARLQVEWSRIVSPIDGVTGVRLVDPGNLVRAGDPTGLVVVTQIDPIAVLFSLPQDDLPQVTAAMAKGKLVVEAFARDGDVRLGAGTLALIDNQINAATATIKLKAVFDNPDRKLWPNQFVKARLTLGTQHGALVVPSTVVQRGPAGPFAYVVDKDDKVAVRPIEIALTQGEQSIVARGLVDGERVVVEGQGQLRAGAKVEPKPADAQPGAKSASPSSSTSSAGAAP